MAITGIGGTQSFSYTGAKQTFTAPYSGVYQFLLYGAEGGYVQADTYNHGGKGGCVVGYLKMNAGNQVHIYVGGQGGAAPGGAGGYNGGGSGAANGAGGGGKTHIANINNTVLLVAGGGGGGATNGTGTGYWNGGNGGGYSSSTLNGGIGTGFDYYGNATSTTAATTSTGGSGDVAVGSFGQGANVETTSYTNAGGGGGGYYGGGVNTNCSGGGGSAYLGGMPSFTYNGTTYTTASKGATNDNGNGSATVKLMDFLSTLYYNGTRVTNVSYNGTTLTKVIYNGTTVFGQ